MVTEEALLLFPRARKRPPGLVVGDDEDTALVILDRQNQGTWQIEQLRRTGMCRNSPSALTDPLAGSVVIQLRNLCLSSHPARRDPGSWSAWRVRSHTASGRMMLLIPSTTFRQHSSTGV